MRTQIYSATCIFIIRLVTTQKTSSWRKSISNLVLLWHAINCPTIAKMCFWNTTLSIGACACCYYCVNWGTDLAYAFIYFLCTFERSFLTSGVQGKKYYSPCTEGVPAQTRARIQRKDANTKIQLRQQHHRVSIPVEWVVLQTCVFW